jgi:hypothetical protein
MITKRKRSCKANYVKAHSRSFQTETEAIHKSSSIRFRENWYALYISIIKSVSINSALDFMNAKPQYKKAPRPPRPKTSSLCDLECESYYFLNVVCGIRQSDLSLLMDVAPAIISYRVCRCRKNYKNLREEQKNERN